MNHLCTCSSFSPAGCSLYPLALLALQAVAFGKKGAHAALAGRAILHPTGRDICKKAELSGFTHLASSRQRQRHIPGCRTPEVLQCRNVVYVHA
jgi:hypothetical protein